MNELNGPPGSAYLAFVAPILYTWPNCYLIRMAWESISMGELGERRWAVISERGCEATRLDYTSAVELSRALKDEKISGLCIVTERAASHLSPAKPPAGQSKRGQA